jgi:hypothetical protein
MPTNVDIETHVGHPMAAVRGRGASMIMSTLPFVLGEHKMTQMDIDIHIGLRFKPPEIRPNHNGDRSPKSQMVLILSDRKAKAMR